MNKAQLVESMVKNSNLSKEAAASSIEVFMSTVTDALKSGDKITLIGFGSFSTVKRAARIGRNPKTGKEVKIPVTIAARFKAGKSLKDAVSGKVKDNTSSKKKEVATGKNKKK